MKKIHLSSVNSTNTYLKENYEKLDNYTFVSTDEQNGGRGRNNREWKSENGKNLLFSLLILDQELIKRFKDLSIIAALSIIETLENYGINSLKIKWPNDVYYQDKKICGILLESITKDKMECLIVGIGLNVNQKEFLGEYLVSPVSMINIINKEIDINDIKENAYKQLIINMDKLKEGYDFFSKISEYDYLKNKSALATINNSIKKIDILGINKDYSLSILNDGKKEEIFSGEISFHIENKEK